MLISVILFVIGLLLLIVGGDLLVGSASGIARKFHLSELLIGATVVSIGTTLPEVMVSATSALGGHGEISYGNAIGSVICNTALIAAITIAVRPGKASRRELEIPVIFFFGSALLYAFCAYRMGTFSRPMGVLLLLIFLAYLGVDLYRMAPQERAEPVPERETEAAGEPLWLEVAAVVAGAALIALGANLLVDHGIRIAQALRVPETVIALTFMAVGTSLPELVTAVTALAKGHSALSLGNVIGANVLNLVLVCGISVTVKPFALPTEATVFGYNASLLIDLPVMFGVMMILVIPALTRQKLYRSQGVLLLVIYAAYCGLQFAL